MKRKKASIFHNSYIVQVFLIIQLHLRYATKGVGRNISLCVLSLITDLTLLNWDTESVLALNK